MFLVWFIIGGFVGGLIGKSRNNTVSGIVWGVLLGPLGWIIVLLLDRRPKCPACQASLNEGASRCAHCGCELGSATPPPIPDNADYKKCPFCAESIKAEAVKCRYCGSELTGPPPTVAT